MRHRSLALAALLSVACFVPAEAADDADGTLYVTAGAVHDGRGNVHRPGAVSIADGRIVAVGAPAAVAVPTGAVRLDAGPGSVVVPGLVGAWSDRVTGGGRDPESITPAVRAIDGYEFAKASKRLLAGGVTTLLVSPGSAQVVSGRAAVVKTAGRDAAARTLRDDAGLVAGIGDSVQSPPMTLDPPDAPDASNDPLPPHRNQLPVTRAGSILLLRRALADGGALEAGGTLFLSADSSGDLDAALALIGETKTKAILVGARDAHAVTDALGASGARVILRWPARPGVLAASDDADLELARLRARGNAAALAAAGIRFALAPESDAGLSELLFVAQSAVRAGLDADTALASVTSRAAELLGVSDRVGALAPGMDGDLVILSGAALDTRSVPMTTIIDGRVAWRRSAGGLVTVVRAAEVHVGDGRVIAPGEISFEDGRIVEIGPTVGIPPGARIIDLGDGSVVPGLIDAFSHAGLRGPGGGAKRNLDTATTASAAADPGDAAFDLLARQGVTTLLAAPDGTGRVAGRSSVIKSSGEWPGRRVLSADAGMVMKLTGESDLGAAAKQLTSALKSARVYRKAVEKYDKDLAEFKKWEKEQAAAKKKADAEAKKKKAADAKKKAEPGKTDAGNGKKDEGTAAKPDEKKDPKKEPTKDGKKPTEKKPDPKAAAKKTEPKKPAENLSAAGWAAVLDGKAPVLVRARTVEEIRAVLRTFAKEKGVRVVLVGADEVRRVTDAVAKAKMGVVASPRVLERSGGRTTNLLRELSLSGLPSAVGSDAYLGGADLIELLAFAVRQGLAPSAAIRMVTGDAAKLLGVDGRVGTLAPGKDADLVLLTGRPFAADARVRTVYVDGNEVGDDAR